MPVAAGEGGAGGVELSTSVHRDGSAAESDGVAGGEGECAAVGDGHAIGDLGIHARRHGYGGPGVDGQAAAEDVKQTPGLCPDGIEVDVLAAE